MKGILQVWYDNAAKNYQEAVKNKQWGEVKRWKNTMKDLDYEFAKRGEK